MIRVFIGVPISVGRLSHRSRQLETRFVIDAEHRERALHAVEEPGGLADRCVMIPGDVDVRSSPSTWRVPAAAPAASAGHR